MENFVISPSMMSFLIITVILFIILVYIGVKLKQYDPLRIKSPVQNMIEIMFDFFYGMTDSMVGKKEARNLTPLSVTIFLSIFLTNIVGMFAMTEAAATIVYPLTLGVSMFLFWNCYGIYRIGIKKYIKGFFQPFSILLPLNIIGELAKPLSLTMRLFGNVLSGVIFMSLIWSIPSLVAAASGSMFAGVIITPVVIVFGSVLGFYFSVFGTLIQAMVFTYLTLSNIGILINEEE